MKPLKHLYLYFQDGQRLALRFPKQSEDPAAVARALRKQLESPFLSIEVDGDLLMIPRESIKYLQVCPMPARPAGADHPGRRGHRLAPRRQPAERPRDCVTVQPLDYRQSI